MHIKSLLLWNYKMSVLCEGQPGYRRRGLRSQSMIRGGHVSAEAQSCRVVLKAMKRGDTYVHFPSTPGEVEKQRHLQLSEGFQVFSKPFSGEFFQSILVALGSLFHFTFLLERKHVKTHPWVEFSSPQRTHSPAPPMF